MWGGHISALWSQSHLGPSRPQPSHSHPLEAQDIQRASKEQQEPQASLQKGGKVTRCQFRKSQKVRRALQLPVGIPVPEKPGLIQHSRVCLLILPTASLGLLPAIPFLCFIRYLDDVEKVPSLLSNKSQSSFQKLLSSLHRALLGPSGGVRLKGNVNITYFTPIFVRMSSFPECYWYLMQIGV